MPYSNEYINWINSREWKAKSKKCLQLTRKHCILFPWLKSRHCHHMTYRNMKSEIPIRDTVALSVIGHKIIHWRVFWKNKKVRPYINYFLRFCMVCSIVFWNILGVFIK